jgi:hypothetical protein
MPDMDIQDLVDYLNELLRTDKASLQDLLTVRAKFQGPVIVNEKRNANFLGIINGWANRWGCKKVVAVQDALTKELLRFEIIEL